jgi:thiol-disulfide isomerase/thioredoxin
LNKRFWILLGTATGIVVVVCGFAFVLDSETLGIGYVDPLAPEGPPGEPETAAIALDRTVPDCALHDLRGDEVSSASLRGPTPTVIEFGSFTCPYCTGQAAPMDRLAEKYKGRVRFVFVYTDEAHPGIAILPDGYRGSRDMLTDKPTPAHRLSAAYILRDTLAVQREILVEPTAGQGLREGCCLAAWKYHPGIVADRDGRVVYAAKWLKTDSLDEFLTQLLDHPSECRPVFDDTGP